jgi:recombination endonuclease VII
MMCNKKPAAVVDHIHGTSLVRGYLCHGCNTGLGKLGDDMEGLQRAMRYLLDNPGIRTTAYA